MPHRAMVVHCMRAAYRGWRTPSGGSPDTTLELSRDYETSNSLDPQEGRVEVSCPAFKRAESAESTMYVLVWRRFCLVQLCAVVALVARALLRADLFEKTIKRSTEVGRPRSSSSCLRRG